MPYQSYPPSLWAPVVPTDGRDSASPGESFTDANITASNALNAGKLAGLGFVASPLTAWTTTQAMTVSTFPFHWSGAAWVAGAVAADEPPPEPEPDPEPTESYTEPTEETSE